MEYSTTLDECLLRDIAKSISININTTDDDSLVYVELIGASANDAVRIIVTIGQVWNSQSGNDVFCLDCLIVKSVRSRSVSIANSVLSVPGHCPPRFERIILSSPPLRLDFCL